ncbi:MAG TPA: tetratricopeptide repeat protein [Bryobacteraceae bacterium]|nr:tetratricopeptide repeat protein [Bryobacteraceae bacterium]
MKGLVWLLAVASAALAQTPVWTYPLPSDDSLEIRTGIEYRVDGEAHVKLDLYLPKNAPAALPAVLFVNAIGSPDLRKHPQYTGWGRLVAGNGLAAIALDTHESDIPGDLDAGLAFLEAHAKDLRIDAQNLVVYICSSNVQAGLPFVNGPHRNIKGAVVFYGSARVASFRRDLPVFLVRAMLDSAQLNRSIDEMVARAIRANAPWSVTNLAAHHGFEVVDDTPLTRDAITRTVSFMKSVTSADVQRATQSGLDESAAAAAVVEQNWQTAIELYRRVTERKPSDSEARRQLGEALLGGGQFDAALEALEKALAGGNGNRGFIALSAAICTARLHRDEDALRWLSQVPLVPGLVHRMHEERAFDGLRGDPRFPAAAR